MPNHQAENIAHGMPHDWVYRTGSGGYNDQQGDWTVNERQTPGAETRRRDNAELSKVSAADDRGQRNKTRHGNLADCWHLPKGRYGRHVPLNHDAVNYGNGKRNGTGAGADAGAGTGGNGGYNGGRGNGTSAGENDGYGNGNDASAGRNGSYGGGYGGGHVDTH